MRPPGTRAPVITSVHSPPGPGAPGSSIAVSPQATSRVARGDELVAVAPRWTTRDVAWGDTAIELPGAPGPGGEWTDVITGARVPGGRTPVALLWRG
ncbi:MAG: hypothetical protein K8M05_12370, partial [Deltaproteobacteria bacterium]|nr:hypothetical protein [Kofleriaceae bacterium]